MTSGYRITLAQEGTRVIVDAPARAAAQVDVRTQIRNEVRSSIQNATRSVIGSREVQQELRQALNNAQDELREAERHLREARTPDQRGAAQQEVMGARAAVSALQSVVREGVTVHTMVDPRTGEATTIQDPRPQQVPEIPSGAVDIAIAFAIMVAVIIIGWPLARAFGRRLERRPETPATLDPTLAGQLQRIEQAVDAMSIEIERISESQRFMAKLQGGAAVERSALGTGERR